MGGVLGCGNYQGSPLLYIAIGWDWMEAYERRMLELQLRRACGYVSSLGLAVMVGVF